MNALIYFLVGTWYITYTNFPMWTEGNKTNPTFNYKAITKKDRSLILLDEVKYTKNGKSHSIKGFDHPDKTADNAFVWKGKGILSPLKSKWRVVWKDDSGQWAVIYFSKTLFTPEGVDIISRKPSLAKEDFEEIQALMAKDSILKTYVNKLKQLYP